MASFEPFFSNPHLLTIAGNFWRRRLDETRFPTRRVLYETEPGTRVLIDENRPSGTLRGEVFLHHGLEGSSQSGYMVSMAQALCEAGFAVHRFNMRGCGGSEHLTDTLYHSGLTADLKAILRKFEAEGRGPRFLVGYSLGGNVSLKLAGELAEGARGLITAVVAVSTPLDLAACVRRLGAKENWIYQERFVRSLKARYRRRHMAFPHKFPLKGLDSTRTVFEFDDRFTSKAFGFGDAPNYYKTQSSLGFVSQIRVPTLLVQAEDDPLIPFSIFRSPQVVENSHLRMVATPHGGHLGFISRHKPRFWVDGEILRFLLLHAEQSKGVDRPSLLEQ